MEKRYNFIDHTADIGIEVYGKDKKELFKNAGIGFFDLITDIKKIKEKISVDIEVNADNIEELMVIWLNELNYIFEVKDLVFIDFDIKEISDTHIKAVGKGERFNPNIHPMEEAVKSVTYHKIAVKKVKDGYYARVIFDI
ncbi:MAG: archease [Deltaproteobacteria bacterium]|nr:archease [Deltaproteobacteria bacterium]